MADVVRVATYNVEMYRKGPGLMLRDILRGDPQAESAARIIVHIAPDILLLQGIDYDAKLHGARAFRDLVAQNGLHYPHVFAKRPNTGRVTGLDMNGDGRVGHAADAQGFGYFAGQRGMVVFSRWPVMTSDVQDFSGLLWRDIPGATLPTKNGGAPFPSKRAQAVQRLSSTGHWIVPIAPPNVAPITLMAFSASPPVFDGPEDRNGLRNADEIRLWQQVLAGQIGTSPTDRFFILGDANLDPAKGQGRHAAIQNLLAHPKLQDTQPRSLGGVGTDTVDWPDPSPGNMRVDYVLPSSDWRVKDTGVFWPDVFAPDHDLLGMDDGQASRHRLVWVDVVASGDSGGASDF